MFRIYKKLLCTIICLVLIAISLGSCNKKPDKAKDLLAKVYKNMAEVNGFSMDSKLVMDTTMSGVTSSVSIERKVGVTREPFELTIVQESKNGEEEPLSTYMYTRKKDKMETFLYDKGQWQKSELDDIQRKDLMEEYKAPIEFALYFNEVDSYTITSSTDEAIVIEGIVSGSNMVNVLKETGALKQLSLTSFPEEQLANSKPIKIKAWVDPKTYHFTKVTINMAETYQDLTNLLFGEDSLVSPTINECSVELTHITINQPISITIPKDIKSSLDKMLQG